MTVTIRHGDCREVLKTMPDQSVHMCVTSPPYFGLRDYGHAGQIGLESTPDAFVAEMVAVFAEVRRVLRDDGTLWLNLGDSYAAASAEKRNNNGTGKTGLKRNVRNEESRQKCLADNKIFRGTIGRIEHGLKPKDLIGIPWRVAFALQADGWYLRQDIIWSKPNPMPESVTDRCTKAHEYIFLMSKSARYFYDAGAVAEPIVDISRVGERTQVNYADDTKLGRLDIDRHVVTRSATRNKRSVWEVTTQPYSDAHFATFPPDLIEPCIKAGCPDKCCSKCGSPVIRITDGATYYDGELVGSDPQRKYGGREYGRGPNNNLGSSIAKTIGFKPTCQCNAATIPGTVIDPFGGAGTTGLVADRLGRNAILIELNQDYAEMAERRIHNDAGLFAEIALDLDQVSPE